MTNIKVSEAAERCRLLWAARR